MKSAHKKQNDNDDDNNNNNNNNKTVEMGLAEAHCTIGKYRLGAVGYTKVFTPTFPSIAPSC